MGEEIVLVINWEGRKSINLGIGVREAVGKFGNCLSKPSCFVSVSIFADNLTIW